MKTDFLMRKRKLTFDERAVSLVTLPFNRLFLMATSQNIGDYTKGFTDLLYTFENKTK